MTAVTPPQVRQLHGLVEVQFEDQKNHSSRPARVLIYENGQLIAEIFATSLIMGDVVTFKHSGNTTAESAPSEQSALERLLSRPLPESTKRALLRDGDLSSAQTSSERDWLEKLWTRVATAALTHIGMHTQNFEVAQRLTGTVLERCWPPSRAVIEAQDSGKVMLAGLGATETVLEEYGAAMEAAG